MFIAAATHVKRQSRDGRTFRNVTSGLQVDTGLLMTKQLLFVGKMISSFFQGSDLKILQEPQRLWPKEISTDVFLEYGKSPHSSPLECCVPPTLGSRPHVVKDGGQVLRTERGCGTIPLRALVRPDH